MQHAKNITVWLCAIFSSAIFFASAPLAQSATKSAVGGPYVVGFPQNNMSNDWHRAQVMAVKEVLDQHANIHFIYSDARGDTAQNIANIESMVKRGIDLLIVSPRNTTALTPVIAKVRKKGIPVVLLTRRILTDDYTAFVAANDDKIAQRAALYMAKQLNGHGRILVLQTEPTGGTATKRTAGFLSEIARYENIHVVAVCPTNGSRTDAVKAVEQALKDGLEFDAIFAQSDSMASGARQALKAAGTDPKSKLIVGIDYITEAREAIRAGEQDAAFTYPTSGREGAELAVRILNGENVRRDVEVPSEMVTSGNVELVDTAF